MLIRIKNLAEKVATKINYIMSSIAIALMAPQTVLAMGDITVGEDGTVNIGGTTGNIGETGTKVVGTMKQILGWVTAGGLIIVVICLVVAGILYATSIGNPQKRTQARAAITGCLVGAAVIGGASLLAGLAYGILK